MSSKQKHEGFEILSLVRCHKLCGFPSRLIACTFETRSNFFETKQGKQTITNKHFKNIFFHTKHYSHIKTFDSHILLTSRRFWVLGELPLYTLYVCDLTTLVVLVLISESRSRYKDILESVVLNTLIEFPKY
jgi:hypothetical protein